MKPFNPNAKCPKCGGVEIGSEKFADWYWEHPDEPVVLVCLTCGYSWPEAPMDKDDAA